MRGELNDLQVTGKYKAEYQNLCPKSPELNDTILLYFV